MNAKIIQIAQTETQGGWVTITALTEDGRVFRRTTNPFSASEASGGEWKEISTDAFVHRLGGLIGDCKP